MKVVLDTNVLISGLFFPGGPPYRILLSLFNERFANVTSPDLLTELERVIRRKFQEVSDQLREEIVHFVAESSEVVYPLRRLHLIDKDEPDNRVLECAVTAKAEFVVSGDKRHLLPLKVFEGIRILSPSDFILEAGIV